MEIVNWNTSEIVIITDHTLNFNSNNAIGANSTPLDLKDITAEFMDTVDRPSANSSAANGKL